jgi:DNA polymerase-3 subunit alpha
MAEDRAVLVQGKVEKDENSVKLIAEAIIPVEKAEETWIATLHISIDGNRTDRDILTKLKSLLQQYPGSCKTFINLQGVDGALTVIELPESFRLRAGPELEREVNFLLGYAAVKSVCSPIVTNGHSDTRPNGKKWEKRNHSK